jgi:hypothetical protein
MPAGIMRLVIDFEKCFAGVVGDGKGEFFSSENVTLVEPGEVFPPQPKKDPSFDAPGDLGSGLSMLLIVFASNAAPRVPSLGRLRFGGEGLEEKRDIVPGREWPGKSVSSYQTPVEFEVVLRAVSLVNLAWLRVDDEGIVSMWSIVCGLGVGMDKIGVEVGSV